MRARRALDRPCRESGELVMKDPCPNGSCEFSGFRRSDARVLLGFPHEDVDQERAEYARRDEPIEPRLMADFLEPQADHRCETAEDGDCDRVGQADAERADFDWEELGFDDRADRTV